MALAGIWAGIHFGILTPTTTDVGWFLVAFTMPTIIYTLGACRASGAHSLLFVTLLLGFIGLDLGHLGCGAIWNLLAAVDLIVCGFTALYIMGAIVLADFGWKLPLGKGWLAPKK